MNEKEMQVISNTTDIVIPAHIADIIAVDEHATKTSKKAVFHIATFKAFAALRGVEKPAKGEKGAARERWNEVRREYNAALPDASRWHRQMMGRIIGDERLVGRKVSMTVYTSKTGVMRRRFDMTAADPTVAQARAINGPAPKFTREAVIAAAKMLGIKLADQPELALS